MDKNVRPKSLHRPKSPWLTGGLRVDKYHTLCIPFFKTFTGDTILSWRGKASLSYINRPSLHIQNECIIWLRMVECMNEWFKYLKLNDF